VDDRSRPADRPRDRLPEAGAAVQNLYRGELSRMTASQQGINSTTSWAISFGGVVGGLALSGDTTSHTIVLVGMVLTLYFLIAEARRFRQREVSHVRVQLVEQGYFPDVLAGNTDWPWVEPLLDLIRNPKPPLDAWAAIGWRLRRTYIWLYLAVLVTWFIKLELTGGPTDSLGALVVRAGVGPLPGWMVLAGVLLFYAGLVALAVTAARRYPQGGDW
jgi:uncharacterized membrane protein